MSSKYSSNKDSFKALTHVSSVNNKMHISKIILARLFAIVDNQT